MTKATNNQSPKPEPPAKKRTTSKVTPSPAGKKGPTAEQKILDFVLMIETRSNDPNVSRKKVLGASGVKSTTFPVTISGMKKKGLIDYDKEFIRLTDAGRAKANPDNAVILENKSTQAVLKAKYKVGGKAGSLYDILCDGREHDRATIQETIGCGNKQTFAVMICNLKGNGLVEYDRNKIKLTDMCFPDGRPSE